MFKFKLAENENTQVPYLKIVLECSTGIKLSLLICKIFVRDLVLFEWGLELTACVCVHILYVLLVWCVFLSDPAIWYKGPQWGCQTHFAQCSRGKTKGIFACHYSYGYCVCLFLCVCAYMHVRVSVNQQNATQRGFSPVPVRPADSFLLHRPQSRSSDRNSQERWPQSDLTPTNQIYFHLQDTQTQPYTQRSLFFLQMPAQQCASFFVCGTSWMLTPQLWTLLLWLNEIIVAHIHNRWQYCRSEGHVWVTCRINNNIVLRSTDKYLIILLRLFLLINWNIFIHKVLAACLNTLLFRW